MAHVAGLLAYRLNPLTSRDPRAGVKGGMPQRPDGNTHKNLVFQVFGYIRQVWNITAGMLGSRKRPFFDAKAKETNTLMPFVVKLLEEEMPHFERLGGDLFLEAKLLLASGKAALKFDKICHEC